MPDAPPREALVLRFRPTEPSAVKRSAGKAFRFNGQWRLSVFADAQQPEEDRTALVLRLLLAAEMSSINLDSNPKHYVCGQAGELMDAGFTFVKDGYDGEVPEHYSIHFDDEPDEARIAEFVAHFHEERRVS